MKKILMMMLCGCMIFSCATSGDSQQKISVAQSVKNEGDIFQSQGNYTAALTKFLEAEKTIPNDPYLQNSLGLAYMGKKRYELAVGAFQKALSLKPDYIEAVNNLGAAYLRQKKWDTAISQFQRVLENLIYPTPHYPLTNMGWAYLGKKDFSNAQIYFYKALEEKPWFITASHGLAQVYLRTGQADRARTYLHKCLGKSPGSAILHSDIALAYEAMGQHRQAIKSWKLVLKLVPDTSSLARKAETHLMKLN